MSGDDVVELPERPVDPDWLALREPADQRARDEGATTLLPALLDELRLPTAPGPGLHVVDLGAGTGANARWLAPRLAALGPWAALDAQRWTLVDHDPRLQGHAPVATTRVRADVADLGALLAAAGDVGLVTASALLDVLERPALQGVVDAVVAADVPALFALSVTGEVAVRPADPLDATIRDAFDAHQRRGGRPGPDAPEVAGRAFRGRGWRVVTAVTPWRLAADEPDLVAEWLTGRVEAAVEQSPPLGLAGEAWLDRRLAQLREGSLVAEVVHADLVALPPARSRPERARPGIRV